MRFAGAEVAVFPAAADGGCLRILAHRAFCASAILRREAADTTRVLWAVLWDAPVPFSDSIPAMTWSNFSISI
jgi:hypothetical protein